MTRDTGGSPFLAGDAPGAGAAGRFDHPSYTIRKQVLKLIGGVFHVYDPAGNEVLYTRQRAFRLREDIRLFTGEDMQTEVLSIQARQVVDFSAAYDVIASASGDKIGALRRKGMRSLLRDEWIVMDAGDREIGVLREDSTGLAVLRRVISIELPNLIPQSYHAYIGETPVCTFKQNFNPFVPKLHVDFSADTSGIFDRRLGIAAGVLLVAVEGKQG